MATCAKMVCKSQKQGKGEDSSPGSRSWSADLSHTLCTGIVVPLYISSREMLHVSNFSASGFPQKGSSLPPARLCSQSPGKLQNPLQICATSSPLTAGEQGQALQGFCLVFCTAERSKRILPLKIVTCTNGINTSCAFKEYYIWNVKGSTAVEGGCICSFPTSITIAVQTT